MNLELYANMFCHGDIPKAHSYYLLAKLQQSGVFSSTKSGRISAWKTGLKILLNSGKISSETHSKILSEIG